MKEIVVSEKLTCFVSNEDYDKCIAYKWSELKKGYAIAHINGKLLTMHHFVIGKPSNGMVVDHINGKPNDNTRENLRFATYSQNSQNARRNDKKKYIGIYFNEKKQSWRAYCKGKYLGSFKDEIEAAKQYDIMALQTFGPCALTNNLVNYSEISENEKITHINETSKNLPKNIFFCDKTKYNVKIQYNGKIYHKRRLKTLEEAQLLLTKFKQDIAQIKANKAEAHNDKIITRNSCGVGTIACNGVEILVDDDKWHELSLMSWYISSGYAKSINNGSSIYMHRMITRAQPNDIVDHINHNKLDNRLNNLRIVHPNVNAHNRMKKINCTSSFIGVSLNKNRWEANVKYQGKKYYCGVYKDEVAAAKAYNIKAIELYGEYANINKIDTNPL